MRAICDRCGFEYTIGHLRKEWTGLMVCHGGGTNECWESRHPQEFVRAVPDNQGVRPGMRPEAADVFVQYANLTLLTEYATDISDAYWTKGDVTISTGQADPDGGSTAEGMLETAVTSTAKFVSADGIGTLVAGTSYLVEAIAAPLGGAGRSLLLANFANGFASGAYAWFDLSAGNIAGTSIQTYGTAMSISGRTIEPMNGGYFRCRMWFEARSSDSFDSTFIKSVPANNSDASFLGTTSKGFSFSSVGVYRITESTL